MAYPSFAQLLGSAVIPLSDRRVVRADGGAARVSSFYDEVKHRFSLRHKLSNTDLQTLRDFFADNAAASFDMTFSLDGVTYTCIFGQNGIRVSPGAVMHDVDVELEEV